MADRGSEGCGANPLTSAAAHSSAKPRERAADADEFWKFDGDSLTSR